MFQQKAKHGVRSMERARIVAALAVRTLAAMLGGAPHRLSRRVTSSSYSPKLRMATLRQKRPFPFSAWPKSDPKLALRRDGAPTVHHHSRPRRKCAAGQKQDCVRDVGRLSDAPKRQPFRRAGKHSFAFGFFHARPHGSCD
jgi:hypothetical protein